MIFEEKTIILKDGRTAILKSPCVEDAEKLLNYIKKSCKRDENSKSSGQTYTYVETDFIKALKNGYVIHPNRRNHRTR